MNIWVFEFDGFEWVGEKGKREIVLLSSERICTAFWIPGVIICMHEFHPAGWVTFITQLNYRPKSHLSIIPDNSGLYSTLAASVALWKYFEEQHHTEMDVKLLGLFIGWRGVLKSLWVAYIYINRGQSFHHGTDSTVNFKVCLIQIRETSSWARRLAK